MDMHGRQKEAKAQHSGLRPKPPHQSLQLSCMAHVKQIYEAWAHKLSAQPFYSHFAAILLMLFKVAPKASKRCSQETTGQHVLKTMGSHSVRGLIQSQNRRVRWYSCRILSDSCRCHMWICIQSRPVLAKTPSPCALCAYTSFRQWRPCTALIPAQMKL